MSLSQALPAVGLAAAALLLLSPPARVPALVAALVLAAPGCRRGPAARPRPFTPEGARRGGQVVVATFADVTTLNDYQSAGEVTESEVIDLLYPTLMVEQLDYSLHPPSFAPRRILRSITSAIIASGAHVMRM